MNRQEFIEKLESFGFPKTEYMILSGGSLLLRGLREQTQDFDLCVSKELAEKLDLQHCEKDEKGYYAPFPDVQMTDMEAAQRTALAQALTAATAHVRALAD